MRASKARVLPLWQRNDFIAKAQPEHLGAGLSMKVQSKRPLGLGLAFPVLLFLVGLGLSALAGYWQQVSIDLHAKEEFERMSVRTQSEITSRMDKAVNALQSVLGLYAANEQVRRGEFRRFIMGRNVERSDLSAFVAAEQRDDAPDFAIRQLENKYHADLFVIKLIEPAANNTGAQGLDVGSETLRRAGIQQAINTGAPTVTGAITLVQDNKKSPGLLLFVPMYQNEASIDIPQERHAALVGVAYAPIVIAEILHGMPDVQSGMLDFEIRDAPINSSGGTLMYDADGHLSGLTPGTAPNAGRCYALRKPLDLPGRSVTLSMSSTPAFDKSINTTFPWLLFGGGVLMSALLASLLHLQASKRRQAEILAQGMTQDLRSAQRDNEALLSTLNLHAIVSIADSGGRILEVNDAFCTISGYSREELIGQDHRIVNSGEQSAAFWVDMWKTISSGLPWRGQVRNLSKGGELFWEDTFIAPYVGADGKIEKYVAIGTDITSSKNSEAQLSWSQSLMDKMSNSSPLAFLVVDNRNDDILYFNQRFCEIWGIEHLAERMRSKALKNNDIIPDCLPVLADVPAFAESCKPLQTEDNRITLEDEIAFTNERTVRRFTTQIRDADDHYFGRFYIFEDVTERKNNELALTKATEVAQAASLAKSQFLSNMSHEIRTPMNAILGMLHLLGATDLNARQSDYADKAESAAKSLLVLLNDILDYSKIEAGKMELDPEPFSVERLLRDLSVIVSSNLGQKPVEVLFDLDPTLPSQLVGDSMRLQQILINLSGNAVKFTERGEIIIQVKVVQQTAESATLRIAVKDSGIGISPENQKRLFSDFSQAEASTTRRFGGTGLGLSICKRLVNLMGGDLLIDSAVGQGSTFHFEIQLPIVQNTSEEPVKLTSAQAQSMRVLVVDDNAMARDLIAAMALSLGWKVDVAQGGAEALGLVQQAGNEYQAIFMDWDMPDMDGWETIERVRAALNGKAAPITVMVTSSGREALSNRSAQEQAQLNAFLVKPITASMLREVVRDAREGRSNLRSKAREGNSQSKRLNGMRVLVVEDNPINQQVARELLIAEGALVEIADNGLLGVSAVTQANKGTLFDAVLMDLQMPVMDGFEATRIIRQDLGLTDLPIVAMTANAMASDREACLNVGMNEHVGKPFDVNHLVAVLLNVSGYQATDPPPESARRDEAMIPSSSSLIDTGIDVDAALARMSGMRTLYTRLVGDFVKALDGAAQEFDRLLAIPSLLDASRHAHTLKGTASTLGATQLAQFASELEKLCKTEADSGVILQQSPALAEVVRSTQASLRQVLELMLPPSAEPVFTAKQRLDKASPGDANAARQAIEELTGLLQNADLAALQRFAELREVLAAVVPEALETLEGAMQGLEFEDAQKICQKIADSLDPTISQS